MNQKQYYVYIATNHPRNTVLYTGTTNDLHKRIFDHKNRTVKSFTSKYNVNKVVWYDVFPSPQEAIESEKKIKGWLRKKKINLIKSINPEFKDLLKEI